MTDQASHTLYICYFGLRQPLVETQVIPYLGEIAKSGIKVSLLTFEPEFGKSWTSAEIESERRRLLERNIRWECLAYHKQPSAIATAYDIAAGALLIRRKIRSENIDVLHGRIHVATLMGALARKFSSRKPKLIFDIRGFFPEEYTDAGVWPKDGWLFRGAKRVERWLMHQADGFVVLTEKARSILFSDMSHSRDKNARPVEVIPCCVDFESRFNADEISVRDQIVSKLGIRNRFVITHVGALGGLYLTEQIVDFLVAARSIYTNTFALFLTQSEPADVISLLEKNGFAPGDYFVGRVDPSQIPDYLSVADVGLSFVKATYATQSRSPTKIPEYLAAGVPIVANAGVGDVDELIREDGVGVLIDNFDQAAYCKALRKLADIDDVSSKCRDSAKKRFDLKMVGGVRYRRLYERLFCKDDN